MKRDYKSQKKRIEEKYSMKVKHRYQVKYSLCNEYSNNEVIFNCECINYINNDDIEESDIIIMLKEVLKIKKDVNINIISCIWRGVYCQNET